MRSPKSKLPSLAGRVQLGPVIPTGSRASLVLNLSPAPMHISVPSHGASQRQRSFRWRSRRSTLANCLACRRLCPRLRSHILDAPSDMSPCLMIRSPIAASTSSSHSCLRRPAQYIGDASCPRPCRQHFDSVCLRRCCLGQVVPELTRGTEECMWVPGTCGSCVFELRHPAL